MALTSIRPDACNATPARWPARLSIGSKGASDGGGSWLFGTVGSHWSRAGVVSLSCLHCGNPPCEAACPRDAITKRPEDGIVTVDREKCFGCHLCLIACSFGVPQFGADGKMQKCDLCLDLITQGKEPACVATCPAEALRFGTLEELSEQATGDMRGR